MLAQNSDLNSKMAGMDNMYEKHEIFGYPCAFVNNEL